ncbi:EamA family transporter RarD [Bacillus shivajii]|uniref:EamA family transporter RarD n=1 Tax=Bacillus shivajii TaxID=1983719 RepID=UPI001CFBD214|nr:EamA family transporter RarD [Bacillus shivajii]UCZ55119.1 EamA family transporter RarD [Bacillus shivajii]
MNENQESAMKWGIISGVSAYLLWGLLPLYWKLIDHIPSEEVLAHRIIWSFIFMSSIILILRKHGSFVAEVRAMFKNKKLFAAIIFASLFIATNWYVYIWAVANDQVVQASLGYYINPLVSVLLGVVFLKEKLSKMQTIAVILAFAAVLLLTFSAGVFPVVALGLALSFGLYGLMKKIAVIGTMTGVALESLLVLPFAAIFLFSQHGASASALYVHDPLSVILLLGAGAVTAVPLLLFTAGARRIPLSLIGFLQYIAPTIMLFLGVFLFQEPFTVTHIVAFSMIWVGLMMFTYSRYRQLKKPKVVEQEITLTERKAN